MANVSQSNGNASTSEAKTAPPESSAPDSLQVGQAVGSYTAKGEKVDLKYSYAGRGERFGEDSVIVLVTDKPIPPEAVAEEIKSQPMLSDGKIRGLEYVFSKDGFWVRFHPSQYQESKSGQTKEYTVEGDTVSGYDEEGENGLTSGKYMRSVRFKAALIK